MDTITHFSPMTSLRTSWKTDEQKKLNHYFMLNWLDGLHGELTSLLPQKFNWRITMATPSKRSRALIKFRRIERTRMNNAWAAKRLARIMSEVNDMPNHNAIADLKQAILYEWLLEGKVADVKPVNKNDTVTVTLKNGTVFTDPVYNFPSEHLIANIVLTIRAGH